MVLYWTALYWEVFLIFCPLHACNREDNKLETPLNIINYDLSNKFVIEWTRFWQCHPKLSIKNFVKV